MELVVLGSGGWFPRGGRATTCLALRSADALVLFDAGTGMARLAEDRFRYLLPEGGSVHLLLSHLHLDHTVGLTFLPALWRETPTTIHVPEVATGEFSAHTVLDRLVGPPFFPHRLADFPMPVAVEALQSGLSDLDGIVVHVREQLHPGGSLGFRVGDAFAFLTDTVYDPDAADFVRGVSVLIHEAWIRGEEDTDELKQGLGAHTSSEQAARVAAEAEVGELLLSHLTPLRGPGFHAGMLRAARSLFPNTQLCEDGLSRLFGRRSR